MLLVFLLRESGDDGESRVPLPAPIKNENPQEVLGDFVITSEIGFSILEEISMNMLIVSCSYILPSD